MAFLEVDNIKALFTEYVAAGVPFSQRLHQEAWGGRDFIVRDPDGNLLPTRPAPVFPYQLSEGRWICSITRTGSGTCRGSSFRPSCS